MGWVFLRHAGTGGAGLYTDEEGLLALLQSRGWERHALPTGIDADDPYAPGALAEVLAEGVETEPILDPEEAGQLRGQELDDALTVAGLSKSGTVKEKQARLAEHEAALIEPPIDPEHQAEPATDNNENEE